MNPLDQPQSAEAAKAAAEAQAKKDKRAEQARINGAKSHGPTTEAGKAKSSLNALKHGFAAEINVLIDPDDSDEWNAHLAGYYDSYRPTNYAERDLVDQIASIRWRQSRLATIETAHIAFQIGIQEEKVKEFHPIEKDNPHLHLVLAWQGLAKKPYPRYLPEDPNVAPDPTQPPDGLDVASIELCRRYQLSLDRQFHNTLLNLTHYRKNFAPQAAASAAAVEETSQPELPARVKAVSKPQQNGPRRNEPAIIPISRPITPVPTSDPPLQPVPMVPEVAA